MGGLKYYATVRPGLNGPRDTLLLVAQVKRIRAVVVWDTTVDAVETASDDLLPTVIARVTRFTESANL